MDKDTILDYVTETPGNTNRAVLGSMLDLHHHQNYVSLLMEQYMSVIK